MLASPEYISLVVKLGQLDLFRTFKTGAHLVRGYADLGHEEFILIGPAKLCSVYTGTVSTLPEGHEHFFSRVPTLEELTDVISRQDFDIKEVEFKDQRTWKVLAENIKSKKQIVEEHNEFDCVMAKLLLAILSSKAG